MRWIALAVVVALLGAVVWLFVGTVSWEGPGVGVVGHYAVVPAASKDKVLLHAGALPRSDLVLSRGAAYADAARLQLEGERLSLVPGQAAGCLRAMGKDKQHMFELGVGMFQLQPAAEPPDATAGAPGGTAKAPATPEAEAAGPLTLELAHQAVLEVGPVGKARLLLLPLFKGRRGTLEGISFQVCGAELIRLTRGAAAADLCGEEPAAGAHELGPDDDLDLPGEGGATRVKWSETPRLMRAALRRGTRTLVEVTGSRGKVLQIPQLGLALFWNYLRCYEAETDDKVPPRLALVGLAGPAVEVKKTAGPGGGPVEVEPKRAAAVLRPVQVGSGARVQIGGASFLLELLTRGGTAAHPESSGLVSLLRTPSWGRSRITRNLFGDDRSRVLYFPSSVLKVPDCEGRGALPLLALPYDDDAAEGPSRVSLSAKDLKKKDLRPKKRHEFSRPRWAKAARYTGARHGLTLCYHQKSSTYSLTGSTKDGQPAPPVIDLWRRAAEGTFQLPGEGKTVAMAQGDHFYFGGQIFKLMPQDRPVEVRVMQLMVPLLLLLAAAPLLLRLFVHGRKIRRRAPTPGGRRPSLARRIMPFAPAIGLFFIICLATLGSWYQLRLATSSRLAAKADYLNSFVNAHLIALLMATFLGAAWCTWFDPDRAAKEERWGRLQDTLGRALSVTLLAGALAAVGIFWLEPLIFGLISGGFGAYRETRALAGGPYWLAAPLVCLALLVLLPRLAQWGIWKTRPVLQAVGRLTLRLVHGSYAWLVTNREYEARAQWSARAPWRLDRRAGIWFGLAALLLATWAVWLGLTAGPLGLALLLGAAVAVWCGLSTYASRSLLALALVMVFVLLWGGAPLLVLCIIRKQQAKELAPMVVVMGGVLYTYVMSKYLWDAERGDPGGQPVPHRALAVLFILVSALAGVAGVVFYLSPLLNDIKYLRVFSLLLVGSFLVLLLWRRTFHTGVLLRSLIPFFLILGAIGVITSDYGAMMVWVPSLSLLMAMVFLANLHATGGRMTRSFYLGNGWAALGVALLPLIGLGLVRAALAEGSPETLSMFHLGRAYTRFELIEAPFYYDAGEWLTQVRWLAAHMYSDSPWVEQQWIANMNSDVALFGLRHYFYPGHLALLVCSGGMLALLFVAMLRGYRQATLRTAALANAADEPGQDPYLPVLVQWLKATLVATAFVAFCMQILIHLGPGALEQLPLTGVPFPWISHGNSTHIVYTSFILFALLQATDGGEG